MFTKKLLLTIWIPTLILVIQLTPHTAYAEDAPIPDSIQEQEQEEHERALSECAGDASCRERANRDHTERQENNKETANRNAEEAATEGESPSVPDAVQQQEQEDYERALSECEDAACIEQADNDHAERQTQNQERANSQAAESAGIQFDTAADESINVRETLRTSEQDLTYFTNSDGDPNTSPVQEVIIRVINYMLSIIGSISLLLIVIAGVMMITSPANEEQRTQATEIIKASVIGLILAFSSFIIVNFVMGLFF